LTNPRVGGRAHRRHPQQLHFPPQPAAHSAAPSREPVVAAGTWRGPSGAKVAKKEGAPFRGVLPPPPPPRRRLPKNGRAVTPTAPRRGAAPPDGLWHRSTRPTPPRRRGGAPCGGHQRRRRRHSKPQRAPYRNHTRRCRRRPRSSKRPARRRHPNPRPTRVGRRPFRRPQGEGSASGRRRDKRAAPSAAVPAADAVQNHGPTGTEPRSNRDLLKKGALQWHGRALGVTYIQVTSLRRFSQSPPAQRCRWLSNRPLIGRKHH